MLDIEEDVNINWTESEKEEDNVSQGLGENKVSTSIMTVASVRKRGVPAFTRGLGPQVNKRRSKKVLSRERRMSLLQDQKVLNGRVFEPTTKNRLCVRELVEAVDFQGWGHLFILVVHILHEWEAKDFYQNM